MLVIRMVSGYAFCFPLGIGVAGIWWGAILGMTFVLVAYAYIFLYIVDYDIACKNTTARTTSMDTSASYAASPVL